MWDKVFSFKFINLPVTFNWSGIIASIIMWLVLTIAAVVITSLTPLDALIVGLIAMLLFWVNDLLHQYGHYLAGKRVGYPMQELYTVGMIAASRYPKNEPDLPAEVHIQRALGGPVLGLIEIVIAGAVVAFFWGSAGTALRFLMGWFMLELTLLTLGSFIPFKMGKIEFDGYTLKKWLPKRKQQSS